MIWRSGNSATTTAVTGLGLQWTIQGVGDFNADGKDDILWRNLATGANAIWRSGSSTTVSGMLGLGSVWFITG